MSWDIEEIIWCLGKAGRRDWYVWIYAGLTRIQLVFSPILSWHVKRKEAEGYEGNHSTNTSTSTVTVRSTHSYTLDSLLGIILLLLGHHINVNLLSKLSDPKPGFILILLLSCARLRLLLLLLLICSNMIPFIFLRAHSWTFVRNLLHFEFSFLYSII